MTIDKPVYLDSHSIALARRFSSIAGIENKGIMIAAPKILPLQRKLIYEGSFIEVIIHPKSYSITF